MTREHIVIAIVIALGACDAGKKPVPAPPPPAPVPTIAAADAGSVAEPVLLDAASPPVDAAVTDMRGGIGPRPHGIGITWIVYPPSVPMRRDPEILQQPVTLEIMTEGTVHTKKLEPQFGALQPYNQSACAGDAYPLQKDELAKLTFYEGGAGGFIVKRVGDMLVVYSWAQTDGLCGTVDKPVECPRNLKRIANVVEYRRAAMGVDERIVEVDDKGVRKPFDCSVR
jgi:hypothetical protein